MERLTLVYTTWPSVAEAEAAARDLVERRLAACANILSPMISVYAWKGAVERAEEAVMILKTRPERRAELMAAVRALHPYDTPAILAVPVTAADERYAQWIAGET